MKKRIIVFLSIFCLFSLEAFADDLFGSVDIHGFISQGFLGSNEHDFYYADTSAGTFEFNELGINFSTELTDNLRLGLQFLARDLGEIGNDEVTIDWAYADYLFRNWLGLRVGKVKTPNGMYNQSRDVDFARTSILLPSSIYNETFRDAQTASKGIGIYGTLPGGIDYQFMCGLVDIHLDSGIVKKIDEGQLGRAGFKTTRVRVDPGIVGELFWETPLEGLRIGASGGNYTFVNVLEMTGAPLMLELEVKAKFVGGAIEYIYNNFVFSAEYQVFDTETYVAGSKVSNPELEEAYVMASYRFTGWFELGTYFSMHFADRKDRDGKKAAALYQASFGTRGLKFREEGWLNDFAITTRFDINDKWIVKLEGHLMNGLADVDYDASDPNPDETWVLYAAKLSYNF